MKFHKPHICDNHTKTLIKFVENAVKEIVPINKVNAIVLLRELSHCPRIKDLVTAYNGATYATYNNATYQDAPLICLSDAKLWVEAIERGESVLSI